MQAQVEGFVKLFRTANSTRTSSSVARKNIGHCFRSKAGVYVEQKAYVKPSINQEDYTLLQGMKWPLSEEDSPWKIYLQYVEQEMECEHILSIQ